MSVKMMLSTIFAFAVMTPSGADDEHCAQSIDGGNWLLVRHTFNKWFDATDGLTGTADYGEVTGPLSDNEFCTPFEAADDTEFLFSFGGCDKWLITTYNQFAYTWGSNYDATILKSHISDVPYTAKWYNRDYCCCEDPWISWADHSTASMIYGECNYGGHQVFAGEYLNVWMRSEQTQQPSTSPPTTAQPSAPPTEEPTRDCSVFHIDEFLMDCSAQFDGHDAAIEGLQDDVQSISNTLDGNVNDIAALKEAVDDLANATATMAEAIAVINDELAVITEYLDRMGDYP